MEEILAKYFSEEASKDERSLVEIWRSESEENAKSFFDAKSIWLAAQLSTFDSNGILEQILEENPKGRQVAFWHTPIIKYSVAASLILLTAFALLFSNYSSNGFQSESLADGSAVALHGNSQIEVLNFNSELREVKITGKAYFDIERDESRPFIIHTDNAIVKVLGTSFVVDNYDSKTEVCVESGVVELVKSYDEVSVLLGKGEMGLVSNSNKGIIKKNNDDPNYLSWKTKVLTFKGVSMKDVGKTLEDVYGIQVEFDNPEFKNCKLTAQFNKKKAKDAIEIIARTFNIEYDYSNGVAILKGKGC